VYSKGLSKESLSAIQPIIGRMLKLREGDSFSFKTNNQSKIRNWLYTWLRLNNMKPRFKIRADSKNQLSIIRIEPICVDILSEPKLTPIQEFVRDNLLELNDEEEVLKCLRAATDRGDITPGEITLCFIEWEKKQGGRREGRRGDYYPKLEQEKIVPFTDDNIDLNDIM